MSPPEFPLYDEGLSEFLRDTVSGDAGLPGFLGIRIDDIGPGTMTASIDVGPELLNPFGSAHGGVVSTLVDHVLGAVLYPVIEKGAWAATTEFKINLLRAVSGGRLSARAEIRSMTKRTAVIQIEVTNDEELAALAQGTVMIKPPR